MSEKLDQNSENNKEQSGMNGHARERIRLGEDELEVEGAPDYVQQRMD